MHDSRHITRKSASNLALAFVLLPRAKWDSMSALYACCREMDDVADDESVPVGQRCERLNISMVAEADEETTLSAGKDLST